MKSGTRRIFSGILVIALAITLSVPAFATEFKSFSDVPSDFWAHDAIMDMVSRGLFAGTKDPDANGVGMFNPNSTMTRAQFITVLTRYLYSDELKNMTIPQGQVWYYNNYELAIKHGLVTRDEIGGSSFESLNKPCTRQEMALLLVRAAEQLGETPKRLVPTQNIADYNLTPNANSGKGIGSYYRPYVRKCFSMGLIVGKDENGTFMGGNTMTRAQGAMVIYRLLEPSTRSTVDFTIKGTTHTSSGLEVTTGVQTWKEGERHQIPKAGDIVIKADGTRVTLKDYTLPNGQKVLGLYQGVDVATGIVSSTGALYGPGTTSWTDKSVLIKDPKTGECYSSQVWTAIRGHIGRELDNKYVGDYDGEISDTWFKWDATINSWVWIGPFFAK